MPTAGVLLLDNILLVRRVSSLTPIRIGPSGSDVVISWDAPASGSAVLQSAPTVDGDYTDLPGASSPYTVPTHPATFTSAQGGLPQPRKAAAVPARTRQSGPPWRDEEAVRRPGRG